MEFVVSQWLLVDFAQLNLMSLPINLTENYVLQVTLFVFFLKSNPFYLLIPLLFSSSGQCPQYGSVCLLPAPQNLSGTGKQQ